MIGSDLPRHDGLTGYMCKHAPHLRDVLVAVLNNKIVTNLLVPCDGPFEYKAPIPMLFTISDDLDKARGPVGFHQDTVRGLIGQCQAVTIVTIWPRPEIYTEAVNYAVIRKANVCIIETLQSMEGAWLKFIVSVNPTVDYALYNGNARERLDA